MSRAVLIGFFGSLSPILFSCTSGTYPSFLFLVCWNYVTTRSKIDAPEKARQAPNSSSSTNRQKGEDDTQEEGSSPGKVGRGRKNKSVWGALAERIDDSLAQVEEFIKENLKSQVARCEITLENGQREIEGLLEKLRKFIQEHYSQEDKLKELHSSDIFGIFEDDLWPYFIHIDRIVNFLEGNVDHIPVFSELMLNNKSSKVLAVQVTHLQSVIQEVRAELEQVRHEMEALKKSSDKDDALLQLGSIGVDSSLKTLDRVRA